MRRFRRECGLKKARILRERLILVSQGLKIGINRQPQEYETAYPYHYIRLIVTGISDTKKALVFLKQHFGDSSFQQTKDRLKELPLLIYSGLDTGTAPLENSLDRWGLMYEKQQISLEKFLEDQAYIRNL